MLSLALFMDRVQTYTAILTGFASQGSDPHRSEEKVDIKERRLTLQYIKQNERKTERGTYGVMFSVLMSPIKAASKSEYNRKKM